ncbi:UNVERIFIED_CONTAM: hypothetical protein Sradi_4833500 [Sesamum radiatum]|uniref:Uncharacterized protein n=1 Tax=Sesamum radiatum TaxID=300843 RepID=A0AAW2N0L2_SESRA
MGCSLFGALIIWYWSFRTVFTPASCWKLNMVGGGNCGRRESRINSRSSFGKLVRMLPTNVNLARRRPNFPTVFPFCRSEGEDVVDTMISYPFAWKVWGLVLFPSSSIPRVPLDFFGWIRLVASSLSTSDLGLFLGLCWTIWWCRNQKLFKGKCLAPDQAVCFARHYIDSYLLQNLDAPCSTPSRSVLHWQRPPQGMVKLNFDGALMDQGGAMGMDIIAQDHMGACIDWILFVCLAILMLNWQRLWRLGRPSFLPTVEAGPKSFLTGIMLRLSASWCRGL